MTQHDHQHALSQEQLDRSIDEFETSIFSAAMWTAVMSEYDGPAKDPPNVDGPAVMRRHVERQRQRLGIDPEDVVGKMLLEQLLMFHLRSSRIHLLANASTDSVDAKVYNDLALGFSEELRRLANDLRQHLAARSASEGQDTPVTFRMTG